MSKSNQNRFEINRRGFLSVAAGGLGAAVLAGCTPAGGSSGTTSSFGAAASGGGSSPYPNYYPAKIPKPDIAGSAKGYEAGYIAYPKADLVTSVAELPGVRTDINGMVLWGVNALPTPLAQNVGWQQLNKKLGADLNLNLVAQADYATKWGTVTASGDLPDMMYISIVPVLPNVAAFMQNSCTELTPYLAGDAVKEYPNLANIPRKSWNVAVIQDKLWGIPIPRPITGWPMYVQTTLLDKLGMTGAQDQVKNAADFKSLCKELTDSKAGRWAFGVTNDTTAGPYSMTWFQGLYRAPNNWRKESGGKLTKEIETEEYKEALVYLRSLIEAGYVSPNVNTNAAVGNDLFGSKIVMRVNAWNAYQQLYMDQASLLGQTYRTIEPFGFDGKEAANMLGPGNFGWMGLKKASDSRIKELLRVANYLAAPFGSVEYSVNKFGVEGKDWNYSDKGAPVLTSQGLVDMAGTPNTPWGYISNPAPWLFSSLVPDYATFAHKAEVSMIDAGVEDPTQGFYSPTDAARGSQLTQLIFDSVSDMAAGRKPISYLSELVTTWKSQGGDQIRAEYEKAIQHG